MKCQRYYFLISIVIGNMENTREKEKLWEYSMKEEKKRREMIVGCSVVWPVVQTSSKNGRLRR